MSDLKEELKETIGYHKGYRLVWDELKVDKYYFNLLEGLKEITLPIQLYVPPALIKFRKYFFGIFNIITPIDRLQEKIDDMDEIYETDEEINSKLYETLHYYVDSPNDDRLDNLYKEIKELINSNIDVIAEIMLLHEKRKIKSLIVSGRRRLAKMKDYELELEKLPKIEDILESQSFDEKVNRLISNFKIIYKIESELDKIVKDETIPAFLKYSGAFAAVFTAVVIGYHYLLK